MAALDVPYLNAMLSNMARQHTSCTIEGCKEPHKAKGFCTGHYRRLLRYGDPRGGPRGARAKDGVPMAWLIDNLSYDGEKCLKWPFADRGNGYGAVVIPDGRTVNVHAYICELLNGPRPSRRHVAAHSCGKGHEGCVNPKHLRWATNSENMLDRNEHGTGTRGIKNNNAKLTPDIVLEMRRLYNKEGWTQAACGRKFGVAQTTAGRVIDGISWAWLK